MRVVQMMSSGGSDLAARDAHINVPRQPQQLLDERLAKKSLLVEQYCCVEEEDEEE